jgi:hypothetical protein
MREGLRPDDMNLRTFAALALLHLPGEEAEARRALAQVPPGELWAYDICETLQGRPEETQALLPQLLSLLTIDGTHALEACALLGELGPRGAAALPRLESLHAELMADPASRETSTFKAVEEALRLLRAANKSL